MLHRRHRDPGPAWRADHWHPTPSYPVAAQERPREQTGSLLSARALWTQASAPGHPVGSYRKIKRSRRPPRKKQNWGLGSLFLSWNLFLQHCLHNPDLGPLAAVHVRREAEQLGILPRARGVEQIFYHGQSATVVLNHPDQKQTVELGVLRFS